MQIPAERASALLLLAAAMLAAAPASAVFNVMQYGATGDGVRLDTGAINKTIDAAASAGGGTVFIPAGVYLSGTIHLKSNVTLWIDRGATVRGTKDTSKYQAPPGARSWYRSLILAHGVRNVAIAGGGTVDGDKVFDPNGEERMRGPHAALFNESTDITVRDVTFHEAANYALILRSCERANIDNVTALGGWDGINMHDTRNVTISNCRLLTGDDCIAGAYWENVTVSNCILNTSCNAFRVGGRNVQMNNCLIYGPGEYEHRTGHRRTLESGFQILPNRAMQIGRPGNKVVRPGPVDNMILSNTTMINVRSPVWIAYSSDAPYSASNLGVGRIIVDNLTVVGAGRAPFYVSAPPENPAKSIVLRNVRMSFIGGGSEDFSQGQGFSAHGMLPAYGLYMRNVEHLELQNVRVDYGEKDLRPALMGENLGTVELDRFLARREPDGPPSLQFAGIRKLIVDAKPAPVVRPKIARLSPQTVPATVGEPFYVSTALENRGPGGLADVLLHVGNAVNSRSVWVNEDEKTNVRFLNLRTNESGDLPVRAGDLAGQIKVRPKPAAFAVREPFKAAQNTDGVVQQLDEGFYVRAGGDSAVLDYADQYAAAYQPDVLARSATVIVKVENPDFRASWAGRSGIMVRNDVSKPGQAAGYLVFGASPSNGFSLEWDSDGDGRIDKHTVFDGYTHWPHWLKLDRVGSKFTGYHSADGTGWVKVGEAEVGGAEAYLDAGVFAHRTSARFTGLKMTPSTAEQTRKD